MIAISMEAREFLRAVERPEGQVVRLEEDSTAVGKRRVRFRIGEPQEGDVVLPAEDEDLLHVAPSVSKGYDGFVVTRVETAEGFGVALMPPEAGEFSS
jgi:hypothetical protein